MALTMQDVRRWLDPEEPDYEGAKAALGPDALPLLHQAVTGGDLALASKATWLAGMIAGDRALPVLRAAHARREPVLSVAVAGSIRNLAVPEAEQVFDMVQGDADAGVRKVALRSAVGLETVTMKARFQAMAARDPEPFVRELATQVLATRRPDR